MITNHFVENHNHSLSITLNFFSAVHHVLYSTLSNPHSSTTTRKSIIESPSYRLVFKKKKKKKIALPKKI